MFLVTCDLKSWRPVAGFMFFGVGRRPDICWPEAGFQFLGVGCRWPEVHGRTTKDRTLGIIT